MISSHWAHWYAVGCSLVIAAVGIGLGALYYAPANLPYFVPTRLSAARAAERFPGLYKLFKNKWYFDDIYWALLVRPCLAFARLCAQIDKILIDGLVNGSAYLTERLSHWDGIFDKLGVDGLVNLLGPDGLRRRRPQPRDPDRQAPQLLDVPGRGAGGAVRPASSPGSRPELA